MSSHYLSEIFDDICPLLKIEVLSNGQIKA